MIKNYEKNTLTLPVERVRVPLVTGKCEKLAKNTQKVRIYIELEL